MMSPWHLSTMQFYLASRFIPPFIISLFFLISFLLAGRFVQLIQIVANKEMSVIIELTMHVMISFLPITIPFSSFFATIFCLSRFSDRSEIIAMQSFGLAKKDIFKPFLILGLSIAFAIFFLGSNLIPYSKTLFKNTITQLMAQGNPLNIRPKVFFTDIPNVVLFVGEISKNNTDLFDVFINYREEEGERTIMAKRGYLIKQNLSQTKTPMLRLKLQDGNIVKYDKSRNNIEKIFFKSYDFPILKGGRRLGFVTKNEMRSNAQLIEYTKQVKKELDTLQRKKTRTLSDNRRLHYLREQRSHTRIEYWSRWNTPFLCLTFIFLGFGLGIQNVRAKKQHTALTGFTIVITYCALFFLGISMANQEVIPPWLAILLPTLLLNVIGVRYYRNINWQP